MVEGNEFGLKTGDGALATDPVVFYINTKEHEGFFPKTSIKFGNPAIYYSSYDGVSCASGGTWQEATAKARAVDSKAREYRAVDIILVVKDTVTVKGKGKDAPDVVAFEAGKKLGHTTSTTNWNNWEAFYRELIKQDLLGKEVEVEVSSEYRTNASKNEWGVLQFKIIGEVKQEETPD